MDLSKRFAAKVAIKNNTGNIVRYELNKGIVPYIELTQVEGGHSLVFALSDGQENDAQWKFTELVQKRHLETLFALQHISVVDVVQFSDSEDFTDALDHALSVGLASVAQVTVFDAGDSITFEIESLGYNAMVTIHQSELPQWAFVHG